jgi:transposase
MSNEEINTVSEKLEANIKLLKEMGFNKITLNDYYTSTMKIVEDLLDKAK